MKFRKRPVVIKAEQFWPEKKPWPKGVYCVGLAFVGGSKEMDYYMDYYIDTLEGRHEVTPGDWVITGVKGEKYPCKPDIFEMTHEFVEDSK